MSSHQHALTISRHSALQGTLQVPGDKSISHRCLIFGALAQGTSHFEGLSQGEDVKSTQRCLAQLGVHFENYGVSERKTLGLKVNGVGLQGLQAASEPLDCGNSGTTFRLLMGVLAAQPFSSQLTGDASLQRRPMTRVSTPLSQLGAQFQLTNTHYAPLTIQATAPISHPLQGGNHTLEVASAQVKSALLLAGLYTQEAMTLDGKIQSRDHTEKMLPDFGVSLETTPEHIHLPAHQILRACDFKVPGDPSSAAFWLAAAALVPGSDVCIENVSLNPTRIGFFEVLQRMGADIHWTLTAAQAEPIGKVRLRYAPLNAIQLREEDIPYLVDEIPLIALLATQAEGESEIRGAKELRIKECDRLAAMRQNLEAMGVTAYIDYEDGFKVTGPQTLNASAWESFHDHRIAMTGVLAGLIARTEQGSHTVVGADSIAVSYPEFLKDLETLQTPRA